MSLVAFRAAGQADPRGCQRPSVKSFGLVSRMPVSLHPAFLVDGRPARLRGRAHKLLLMLTQQQHRVVSRGELLSALWPNATVNENNLNVQIAALRKALGPDAIATIPGRGYRLTLGENLGGAASAAPPADPLNNLPAPLGRLLGRGDDLAQLESMLSEQPLVTVVGAGGIGKTRLALEAARARLPAHSDGVWWVELATLTADADADAVARAVAAAIGLSLRAGKAPTESLLAALRLFNSLIVLDNAEHLAQATAMVVDALQAAPALRWLVTSQVPLKLQREQLFALGTLSVPPADASFEQAMGHGAMALLVQRAHAINHGYQLEPAELAAAIGICRRLDGIALALEMAAARLAWLGADALNKRLARSSSGLGPGSRVAPTRQQTLRATLDWSHALLTPAERNVLRRLGVFVGGFTLEAAQHVTADEQGLDEWAVLDALAGLVDKSWVQVGRGNRPRYHLLESARVYALERLDQDGEGHATRARHASAMAKLADGCTHVFLRESSDTFQVLGVPEGDNLVASFDWALGADQDSLAARIFVGMVNAIVNSRRNELQARADALLPRLDGLPPTQVAHALTVMGLAKGSFDQAASIAFLHKALELLRAGASDVYWLHYTLCLLSQFMSAAGRLEEAHALASEARAMRRPGWPAKLEAFLGMAEIHVHLNSVDPEAALEPARRAIELADAIGLRSVCVAARTNLVSALVDLGRYDDVIATADELVPLLMGPRGALGRLLLLCNLSLAQMRTGSLERAHCSVREALPLTRTFGYLTAILDCAAELALLQDRKEVAAQLIGHVQTLETAGRSIPQPTQLRGRRAVLDRLAQQLSTDELARWLARGATLSDDQIDALVCDGPPSPP
jgi:predicted ATPase